MFALCFWGRIKKTDDAKRNVPIASSPVYSISCLDNICAGVFLKTLKSGNKPTKMLKTYISTTLVAITLKFNTNILPT